MKTPIPFTIKQVTGDGEERLWPAVDVRYVEPSLARHAAAESPGVKFNLPDGSRCSISGGIVFVMNEAGATVAKYHMGTPDEPHGEAPRHTP